MQKSTILSAFIILILSSACKSDKNSNTIFGSTWELEYLSGPGNPMAELFSNKKPYLSFNQDTMRVEGNSGCNGYSADFTLEGNKISFGEPGPTTMMYCGEGENFFIGILKNINKYKIDSEGKLSLLVGDVPFMRFKKTD